MYNYLTVTLDFVLFNLRLLALSIQMLATYDSRLWHLFFLTVTCTDQLLHSAETSCHVFWGSLHSQTAQCTRHPGSDCFPQSHRDVKLVFHWPRC